MLFLLLQITIYILLTLLQALMQQPHSFIINLKITLFFQILIILYKMHTASTYPKTKNNLFYLHVNDLP